MARRSPRGYIADKNVLSNRGQVHRDPNLAAWLGRHARSVGISVITIAEMRRGLLLLEAKVVALADPKVRRRGHLRFTHKRDWYNEITGRFADRIEPIDVAVAERWAEISVRFPSLRDADKAIAATALVGGYGVATENVGDFRHAGLVVVNPFDPATWPATEGSGGDDDPLTDLM